MKGFTATHFMSDVPSKKEDTMPDTQVLTFDKQFESPTEIHG
jgi:hypothetical protein